MKITAETLDKDLENSFSNITLNETPSNPESELERKLLNLTLNEPPKECEVNNLKEQLKNLNLEKHEEILCSDDENANVSNKSLCKNIKEEIEDNLIVKNTNKENVLKKVSSEQSECKTKCEDNCQNNKGLRKRGPLRLSTQPIHETSRPYGATRNLTTWISTPTRESLDNSNDRQLFMAGGSVLPTDQDRTVEEIRNNLASIVNQAPPLPEIDFLLSDTEELNRNEYSDRGQLDTSENNVLEDVLDLIQEKGDIPDFSSFETLIFHDTEQSQTSPIAVPVNINSYPKDQFSPASDDTGFESDLSNMSSSNSPIMTLAAVIGPRFILPNENSAPIDKKQDKRDVPSHRERNSFYHGLDPKLREKYHRIILKIARKTGLNQKDQQDRNILHVAILSCNTTYAVVLINMLQKSFQNVIQDARKEGLSAFKDLPSYLNQQDALGWTALNAACVRNIPLIVDYLLECGASSTLSDKSTGDSPFHYVAKRGKTYFEVLEKLCTKSKSFINVKNLKGQTPLHVAVQSHGCKLEEPSKELVMIDNLPVIKLLLENGARLDSKDKFDQTPLHWLISCNKLDLLTHMYDYGCNWDQAVNLGNNLGRTVLHLAVIGKGMDDRAQKEAVEKLIVRNASTKIQDSEGKYAKDFVTESKMYLIGILNQHWSQNIGFVSEEDHSPPDVLFSL